MRSFFLFWVISKLINLKNCIFKKSIRELSYHQFNKKLDKYKMVEQNFGYHVLSSLIGLSGLIFHLIEAEFDEIQSN